MKASKAVAVPKSFALKIANILNRHFDAECGCKDCGSVIAKRILNLSDIRKRRTPSRDSSKAKLEAAVIRHAMKHYEISEDSTETLNRLVLLKGQVPFYRAVARLELHLRASRVKGGKK